MNPLENHVPNLSSWIKKLLRFRPGDEEEVYAEKAVSLIKKKHPAAWSILERQLASPQNREPCVLIPKSKDGRWQINHRKGLPHVIVCRLFRYKDLQNHHELKAEPWCLHPWQPKCKQAKVCINPFHYSRIATPNLPTVLVPRVSDPMPGCSHQEVPYAEQEQWCRIAYYELDKRVGDLYHTNQPDIWVDGFTHPSGSVTNRFSLGQLSCVNRTKGIEQARRHIGKGLRLNWGEGKLWVECLSDSPIFIHSKSYNRAYHFSESTVVKLSTGGSLVVFDGVAFAAQLDEAVHRGYDFTYGLQSYCTIRMSLGKGWGAEYHRQDITSTPCWIEVHLNGPSIWLDSILRVMDPISNPITSFS